MWFALEGARTLTTVAIQLMVSLILYILVCHCMYCLALLLNLIATPTHPMNDALADPGLGGLKV